MTTAPYRNELRDREAPEARAMRPAIYRALREHVGISKRLAELLVDLVRWGEMTMRDSDGPALHDLEESGLAVWIPRHPEDPFAALRAAPTPSAHRVVAEVISLIRLDDEQRRARARSRKRGRGASPDAAPPPRGMRVPPVPTRLGDLFDSAHAAVNQHGGASHPMAVPASQAAESAVRRHVDAYAHDFTASEHRHAARIVGHYRDASPDMDRRLRDAHNAVQSLHEELAARLDRFRQREVVR